VKKRPAQTGTGEPSGGGRGARGTLLRRHNLATLLEHVHLEGASSRSELATLTGLNRSTIADLVDELVTLGLAEESGVVARAGPGRPSPIVRPRPQGATVLAIELAVDSFAVATVGLGGEVLAEERVTHPRKPTSPHIKAAEIARTARPLLDGVPPASGVGVGVAVVGLTRRTDGFVHLAPNLGWRDVPFAELLAAALSHPALPQDVPVLVANEADLGALAEHRRGAGRGVADLVYVSGEVGIGIGVIAGGVPMLGAAGYAGEAGHMLVNPNGRSCGCGARGCWETEAGELALLRHAGVSPNLPGPAAVDEVIAQADRGERAALDAIAEIGWWLGLGAGDLVNLFNPRLVVLGGLHQRLFARIEDAMRSGLSARALAAAEQLVEIVPSPIGLGAPLLGAAELAFDRLLADPAGAAPAGVSA
jgi:predicted NBD/HSP70 family sugar kinase